MADLKALTVEVPVVVVPTLQWGDEQYPIEELLKRHRQAKADRSMLKAVLDDLDRWSRARADAQDRDQLMSVMVNQQRLQEQVAISIRSHLAHPDS